MSQSSEKMKESRSHLAWVKRQLAQAFGFLTSTVAEKEVGILPFPMMAELATEPLILPKQEKEGSHYG